MIKLTRVRTKDAVISSFRGKTPVNRLVGMMKEIRGQLQAGDPIKPEIKSKWSKTKDQLLIESSEKCAYCESSLSAVSFGDVEHYRPKSVYWWLAYVYDNYLASCSICNQRFKSNKFEAIGPALKPPKVTKSSTDAELEAEAKKAIPDPLDLAAVKKFEKAHRNEAPMIPNPYIDDPETVFGWEVLEISEDKGEVTVVPLPGVKNAKKIVAACEEIYGINRPQLRRRRFKSYQVYRQIKDVIEFIPEGHAKRAKAERFLASMSKDNSEYSAMIRFLEQA